jgi:flavin-dependent dehydrogenase
VIAGAGPAGATLALRLARAGLAVTLLDRAQFPRGKPCGEFMSPQALPILDELGVRDAVLAAGAHPVRGLLLFAGGRAVAGRYVPVGRAVPLHDHGYGLRREVFDSLLVDAARAAGADLRTGFAVTGLERDADGRVTGVTGRDAGGERVVLRAPIVVGADGLASRVAKSLGVRRERTWLRRIAVTARYDGVPVLDRGEVHFFPGGYFAATSVDHGSFRLNLVLDATRVAGGRRELAELFAGCLAQAPQLAERLRAATLAPPLRAIGPLSGSTTRQVVPGAALVGDACGYVDPLTGEGIYFALRGAQLLAPRLLEAVRRPADAARALARYQRERARALGPHVTLALALQRGLRHPRVVRGLLAVLARWPHLADLLVSLTGDYVPIRSLLDPRVFLPPRRAKIPA